MCTVTWLELDGGYHLFCSRDELRSRGPALAPRLHRSPAGRFLAPVDPDGGGTWVAVNDRGVALSLLNDYAADAGVVDPGRFESRGRLVFRLAAEASPAAVEAALAALDLQRYRPFRLVVLAPGVAARIRHWDGRREAEEAVSEPPLVTSSSFDPAAADRSRRRLLAGLRPAGGALTPETLAAFHRSHRPVRGPLSPCMHRDDASTVSFARLRVTRERAILRYRDGPPCRGAEPVAESRVDAGLAAGEPPHEPTGERVLELSVRPPRAPAGV